MKSIALSGAKSALRLMLGKFALHGNLQRPFPSKESKNVYVRRHLLFVMRPSPREYPLFGVPSVGIRRRVRRSRKVPT